MNAPVKYSNRLKIALGMKLSKADPAIIPTPICAEQVELSLFFDYKFKEVGVVSEALVVFRLRVDVRQVVYCGVVELNRLEACLLQHRQNFWHCIFPHVVSVYWLFAEDESKSSEEGGYVWRG